MRAACCGCRTRRDGGVQSASLQQSDPQIIHSRQPSWYTSASDVAASQTRRSSQTMKETGKGIGSARWRGANCLLLAISYRDDLRVFFAWNSRSNPSEGCMQLWAWQQLTSRFRTGTMLLDGSEPFVGLICSWRAGRLFVRPRFPDPFAAYLHSEANSFPLVPWCSWMLPQQRKNAVSWLLCRAF